MNEKNKIKITLISEQEESIAQYFFGELFIKGQAIYIKYTESIENQDVRHLIRYSPNELKITRFGAVQSEQTYILYERTTGSYVNSMVRLQVEAETKRLLATDRHGNIILGIPHMLPFNLQFDYDLYVDGQLSGQFKIQFTVEEADV